MFYTALFCYWWSIPKHASHITIASVTGVLFFFLSACIWAIWESSDKGTVWLEGLPSPIVRALRALHPSRLRHAVGSFRKLFRSNPTNDVSTGGEYELAAVRVQVVGGEVQVVGGEVQVVGGEVQV